MNPGKSKPRIGLATMILAEAVCLTVMAVITADAWTAPSGGVLAGIVATTITVGVAGFVVVVIRDLWRDRG